MDLPLHQCKWSGLSSELPPAYLTIHSSRVTDERVTSTSPVMPSARFTLVNLLSKDGACCAIALVVAGAAVNVNNRRIKRFGE